MNRFDFQKLAEMRVKDAQTLLTAQNFDGAYYLAGYAVECALKACIAKRFQKDDIPDKKFVNEIFTHDLTKLLEQSEMKLQVLSNPAVLQSWGIVKEWSEQARYELGTTKLEAEQLFSAVTDSNNGVLPWLKTFW